jgi:serine/threonine protein kinase
MIHRGRGDIVARHYRLETLLGEGGMGQVWAARDTRDGTRLAVKLLKSGSETSPDKRRRFLREARAAMAVSHPHIVHVREVATDDDDAPVIVMDLLEGETLRARLTRGPMPVAELARIMLPVISALGTAHALGIVHRDLKPENLFLARGDGGDADVKVLDFGIAKLRSPEGPGAGSGPLTETGTLMGTPQYMSPEQVFGERDIDHRSDIWSLGAIFYECLTGRQTFVGDNVGQIIKAITSGKIVPLREVSPLLPPALLDVCDRMLEVDRVARPSDLREVASVIQGFTELMTPSFQAATLEVVASSTDGVATAGGRRGSRGRLRAAAAWAAAAVTVGAVAVVATIELRRGSAGSIPTGLASSPPASSAAPLPPPGAAGSVAVASATATAPAAPAVPPELAHSISRSVGPTVPASASPRASAWVQPPLIASGAPSTSASARNVLPGGVAPEVPY